MNNVLSLVHSARLLPEPGAILYSDHMLAELAALHDDMVGQLRLECLRVVGSTGFLTGLIEQHEKTAAELRSQLGVLATESAPPGAPELKARLAPKRRGRWLRRLPSALKRHLRAAL